MENLIALVALTAMEIVLGIDNIVFIVILSSRLPKDQQPRARRLGLALAMIERIALLLLLSHVLHLTKPLFHLTSLGVPAAWLSGEEMNAISIRDVILLAGGLFLIAKSVFEIHEKTEGREESERHVAKHPSLASVVTQIMVLDVVFSLDSVITAVGMANDVRVMIAAVVLAVIVMMIFSEKVSVFIEDNPTLKMLALSFLLLIGVTLVAEGMEFGMNKGYIYFAMAFALGVEFLNIRVRRVRQRRVARKGTAA